MDDSTAEFTPGAPVVNVPYTGDTKGSEQGTPSGYRKPKEPDIVVEQTAGMAVEQQEYLPPPEPARDFARPDNAAVIERDAAGNPTILETGTKDEQGNRIQYYTPNSTMWDAGFKNSLEYNKERFGLGGERAQVRGPWVSVEKAGAEMPTHITQAEAQIISRIKGERQFERMKEVGIIPPNAVFVPQGKDWAYYTPPIKAEPEAPVEKDKPLKEQKIFPILLHEDTPKGISTEHTTEQKPFAYLSAADIEMALKQPSNLTKTTKTAQERFADVVRFLTPESPETLRKYKDYENQVSKYNAKWDIYRDSGVPVDKQQEYTTDTKKLSISLKILEKQVDDDKNILLSGFELKRKSDKTYVLDKNQSFTVPGDYDLTKLSKQGLALAEIIVPFLAPIRRATIVGPTETALNIGIDAAALLLGYGLVRAIGRGVAASRGFITPSGRALRALDKLAVEAGKAGENLVKAKLDMPFISPTGESILATPKASSALQHAVQASSKADKEFLDKLGNIPKISVDRLKKIEVKSGMKGLTNSVLDIGKAQGRLEKAWRTVESTTYNPEAKGKLQLDMNRQHLFALGEVQKAHAGLQTALDKAGSVMAPRYKPSPAAPEFVGVEKVKTGRLILTKEDGGGWSQVGKAQERPPQLTQQELKGYEMKFRKESPIVIEGDSSTIKDIGNLLKEDRIHKTQAAIAEAETARKAKAGELSWALETKPIWKQVVEPEKVPRPATERPVPKEGAHYKEGVKETPIYKEPKKGGKEESVFPGIKEAKKPIPLATSREGVSPLEKAKVTGAKAEELYGGEEDTAYIAKTIEEHMRALQSRPKITDEFQIAVRGVVSTAIQARNKALNENLTNIQTKLTIKESIKEAIKQQAALKTLTQTQIETMTRTAVQAALKSGVAIPIRTPLKPLPIRPIKPPPIKPRVGLLFPPIGASDNEKRVYIKKSKGSVAYRRGELGGQGVWHTWPYPFDKRIIVMGAAPEGATIVTGPGSAYKTIQSISGGKLGRAILEDTGAIDTRISTKDGKVDISFFRDRKAILGHRPRGKITKR